MDSATSPTREVMGRPPSVHLPHVGAISPVRMRDRVVLPDPLSPVMSTPSPASTIRETSRRTVFSHGVATS